MGKKGEDSILEHDLTYEDYAALPDDEPRFELADGMLEMMSPGPSPRHQIFCQYLSATLLDTCGSDYIIIQSPLDVILSPTNVLQPDIVAISKERMPIITNRGIEGAPDLVVEVLSPSSVDRDRGRKMRTFAQFAIPEYWIIDMENGALEQYTLDTTEYQLAHVFYDDEPVHSNQLPCAAFSVANLLARVEGIGLS